MRILHVFRSPVGGLFRHVRDLAKAQSTSGHDVGIFCDSSTGGMAGTAFLDITANDCSLGIHRKSISKFPGFGDLACAQEVKLLAKDLKVDIIHGHGAKGGLYGRVAGKLAGIPSVYSPHGGSLHYMWKTVSGAVFLGTEMALGYAGSGYIFVCEFEKNLFSEKIGLAGRPSAVVHNGLWQQEFGLQNLNSDATDLLFVGEMRKLKGVDVLLRALAQLNQTKKVTLTLVGEGSDQLEFENLSAELKLEHVARFVGRHNMAEALKMGQMLIVPSRNESFPYVILEAAAATTPIIASNVGGIGEILSSNMMCNSDDVVDLTKKIALALEQPSATKFAAQMLAEKAKLQLSVELMAKKVCAFYQTITSH